MMNDETMIRTNGQDPSSDTVEDTTTINIEQLRDIVALSFKRILLQFYIQQTQTSSMSSVPHLEASPPAATRVYYHVTLDAFHQAAMRVHNASARIVYSLNHSSPLCKLSMNHMLHKTLHSVRLLHDHITNIMDIEERFIFAPDSMFEHVDVTPPTVTPRSERVLVRSQSISQGLTQVTTVALECIRNLEDCLDIFDLYGVNEFDPYFRLSLRASVRWSIPNPAVERHQFEDFLRSPGMCMPDLQPQSPPVNVQSQTESLTSIENSTNLWIWRHPIIFLISKLVDSLENQIGTNCFDNTDALAWLRDIDEPTQYRWSRLIRTNLDGTDPVDLIMIPNSFNEVSTYSRNLYEILRACLGARERVSLLYWYQKNFTD